MRYLGSLSWVASLTRITNFNFILSKINKTPMEIAALLFMIVPFVRLLLVYLLRPFSNFWEPAYPTSTYLVCCVIGVVSLCYPRVSKVPVIYGFVMQVRTIQGYIWKWREAAFRVQKRQRSKYLEYRLINIFLSFLCDFAGGICYMDVGCYWILHCVLIPNCNIIQAMVMICSFEIFAGW